MKTMSIRIWSQRTVVFLLISMVILTSVGQATGRSGRQYFYGSSDSNIPLSRRHCSSERKDNMKLRELAPPKTRFLNDPELLFQRLDDLESGDPKKMSPGKKKSENSFIDSKDTAAVTFKEIVSQFPSDANASALENDDEELTKDEEDPFESLAQMNFDEQNLQPKDDREQSRRQGFHIGHQQDGKPAVATANLLAKVISSNVDQSGKFQTCQATTNRPMSTMKSSTTRRSATSTTERSPTTFCLPEPSSDQHNNPLPAPSTLPTPPPSSLPPSCPPSGKLSGERTMSNKFSTKSKSPSPKGFKTLLNTILASKQNALSVLKALNYLEMELLSQSEDDGLGLDSENLVKEQHPKKTFQRLGKPKNIHSRLFSFGIRPASQQESMYDLALAKEEEIKLEDRVWEEHQKQIKLKRPIKPKRFEIAPAAAARLEPYHQPQKPQQSLESLDSQERETPGDDRRINLEALSVVVKPMSSCPSKDTHNPLVPWNQSPIPSAEMKAIRVQGPIDNELISSKRFQKRKRKRKKLKLYAQKKEVEGNKISSGIAGVFY
ncbi:uncharacterized protein LOC108108954 [Drosophila eugracilis]|uniref:uncharacterized protein LOC108108954 n=1 Tax=Drosophila eugracilis TaxID=29029 RepID=UPI0007E73089|nr:uncharacterized protein LOC108108954 [Drosophila eugracilis]